MFNLILTSDAIFINSAAQLSSLSNSLPNYLTADIVLDSSPKLYFSGFLDCLNHKLDLGNFTLFASLESSIVRNCIISGNNELTPSMSSSTLSGCQITGNADFALNEVLNSNISSTSFNLTFGLIYSLNSSNLGACSVNRVFNVSTAPYNALIYKSVYSTVSGTYIYNNISIYAKQQYFAGVVETCNNNLFQRVKYVLTLNYGEIDHLAPFAWECANFAINASDFNYFVHGGAIQEFGGIVLQTVGNSANITDISLQYDVDISTGSKGNFQYFGGIISYQSCENLNLKNGTIYATGRLENLNPGQFSQISVILAISDPNAVKTFTQVYGYSNLVINAQTDINYGTLAASIDNLTAVRCYAQTMSNMTVYQDSVLGGAFGTIGSSKITDSMALGVLKVHHFASNESASLFGGFAGVLSGSSLYLCQNMQNLTIYVDSDYGNSNSQEIIAGNLIGQASGLFNISNTGAFGCIEINQTGYNLVLNNTFYAGGFVGLLDGSDGGLILKSQVSQPDGIEVDQTQVNAVYLGGLAGNLLSCTINDTMIQLSFELNIIDGNSSMGCISGLTTDGKQPIINQMELVISCLVPDEDYMINMFGIDSSNYTISSLNNVIIDCSGIQPHVNRSMEQCMSWSQIITTGLAMLGSNWEYNELYNFEYPFIIDNFVKVDMGVFVMPPDSSVINSDTYFIDGYNLTFPIINYQICHGNCQGNYSSPVYHECTQKFNNHFCYSIRQPFNNFQALACIDDYKNCSLGVSQCNSSDIIDFQTAQCIMNCDSCQHGFCNFNAICVCDPYYSGDNCSQYDCNCIQPSCFGSTATCYNSSFCLCPKANQYLDQTTCKIGCFGLQDGHGQCIDNETSYCFNYFFDYQYFCDGCSGFGDDCSISKDDCRKDYCNSNGNCTGWLADFSCTCDDGYDIEDNCSTCLKDYVMKNGVCVHQSQTSSLSWWEITLIVILVLFAAICFAWIIILLRKSQGKATANSDDEKEALI